MYVRNFVHSPLGHRKYWDQVRLPPSTLVGVYISSAELIFPSATSTLLVALSAALNATRLFPLAHHHPSNILPSASSSLHASLWTLPLSGPVDHSHCQRTVNGHDESITQLSLRLTRYLYSDCRSRGTCDNAKLAS